MWFFGPSLRHGLPFKASQSHSFIHTALGRTPLHEWSARRIYLLFYGHNNQILHESALFFPINLMCNFWQKLNGRFTVFNNVVYIFTNFHFPGDWRSWKGWRFSLRLLFALLSDVSWVSGSIYPNYLLQCRVLKLCLPLCSQTFQV